MLNYKVAEETINAGICANFGEYIMLDYKKAFELVLNGTWTITDFSVWIEFIKDESYSEGFSNGYDHCDNGGGY